MARLRPAEMLAPGCTSNAIGRPRRCQPRMTAARAVRRAAVDHHDLVGRAGLRRDAGEQASRLSASLRTVRQSATRRRRHTPILLARTGCARGRARSGRTGGARRCRTGCRPPAPPLLQPVEDQVVGVGLFGGPAHQPDPLMIRPNDSRRMRVSARSIGRWSGSGNRSELP